MSDIAPFVAAMLRDKVVQDMEKEIQTLRGQLQVCQRVEIRSMETRDDPTAVLAHGKLEDGTYERGGNLFRIPLQATATTTPLSQLCNLRVTVGGIHQGQLSAISDFRPNYETTLGNSETSRGVLWMAQSQQLSILVIVHGWPESDWSRRIILVDATRSLDLFLVELPKRYPEATVSFEAVYLNSDVNRTAIGNLPEPVLSKLEQGLEQSQAQFVFTKLVTNRMRFVLDSSDMDGSTALVPQVEQVLDALSQLEITRLDDLAKPQVKQTMEYLIQTFKLAKEAGRDEIFTNCVDGLLLQKKRKEKARMEKVVGGDAQEEQPQGAEY